MMKEKFFTITFLVVSILLSFCPTAFSRQGVMKGQVVDGFENVLKDVEIKIKKTKLTTKTDENGNYKIKYNPGKVEISFKKKGYSTRKFTFNLHDVAEVPMQKLSLWKIPETGGMFIVRMNDYKKIEKVNFYSESDDKSIRFYVKEGPVKIILPSDSLEQGRIKMMVLDYSKDEPLVVGKTLYKTNEQDLIGSIVFESRDWHFGKTDDQYTKISNRVGLRYVDLEPGKYFYCIGEITLRSRVGYGYYLEITTPELLDKEKT